jgi:AcrR family transcriptional regulator
MSRRALGPLVPFDARVTPHHVLPPAAHSPRRQPPARPAGRCAAAFCQRGYAATTMRDIAEGAQMLPGSLYYHFRPRNNCWWRCTKPACASWTKPCRRHRQAAEPWARLEAACTAHLETISRQRLRAGADPRAAAGRAAGGRAPARRCAASTKRAGTRWWPRCRCHRAPTGGAAPDAAGRAELEPLLVQPRRPRHPAQLARKFIAFLKKHHAR